MKQNLRKFFARLCPVLIPFRDLVSEMAIFVLDLTSLCFEVDKIFIKEKMCGTNNFYFKIFSFLGNSHVRPRYGQKTVLGYPSYCPYLCTCTKSENWITGVFLSICFAACKEKLKSGEGQKNISWFWFFFLENTCRKLKISKNPETFTIKIISCTRFVLYKLFCS